MLDFSQNSEHVHREETTDMERAKMMQGVQACARLIMNYECVFTY